MSTDGIGEILLLDLEAGGKSLQNGRRGDMDTLCHVVGQSAQVIVAMARQKTVLAAECKELHGALESRLLGIGSGGKVWLEYGKLKMGGKSVGAVLAMAVIVALAYIGAVAVKTKLETPSSRVQTTETSNVTSHG